MLGFCSHLFNTTGDGGQSQHWAYILQWLISANCWIKLSLPPHRKKNKWLSFKLIYSQKWQTLNQCSRFDDYQASNHPHVSTIIYWHHLTSHDLLWIECSRHLSWSLDIIPVTSSWILWVVLDFTILIRYIKCLSDLATFESESMTVSNFCLV